MLRGVFFLQPLAVEAAGLQVECALADGRFEVRSGESDGATADVAVHCSGNLAAGGERQRIDHASARCVSGARGAAVGALYDGFDAAGLQYGPGYRTLRQAWGGGEGATARLGARSTHEGTAVHPADLDDGLCLGALVPSEGSGEGGTRLPFAVDEAALRGVAGALWAVAVRQGGEAMGVGVGGVGGAAQAQLEGFKSRSLRLQAANRHDRYATEWGATTVVDASATATLLTGQQQLALSMVLAAHKEVAAPTHVVAAASTVQHALLPLSALEAALAQATGRRQRTGARGAPRAAPAPGARGGSTRPAARTKAPAPAPAAAAAFGRTTQSPPPAPRARPASAAAASPPHTSQPRRRTWR